MNKNIIFGLVGATLISTSFPSHAAGYRQHNPYESGHHRSRHHNNGGRLAAGLIGGIIIGALLADSGKSERRVEPTYSPQAYPQWAEPVDGACQERQITERTMSGRLVTYSETLC